MQNGTKAQIVGKITGKVTSIATSQFGHAADFLKTLGYDVFNPIEQINQGLPYEEQMQICLDNIPNVDVLVLLEDWPESPGARREVSTALKLNKKITCLSSLVKQRLYL